MKRLFPLFTIIFLVNISLNAQVIWTGPLTTFTKSNGADWTMASNQDQITSNVHLTRANNKGLFNILNEASYVNFSSPDGTRWAYGSTSDFHNLNFSDWETTHGSVMPMLNQDMVVHLVSDNIYIDITITSWSGGMNGGFSYIRSTGSSSIPVPAQIPTMSQWGLIILGLLFVIVGVIAMVNQGKPTIRIK